MAYRGELEIINTSDRDVKIKMTIEEEWLKYTIGVNHTIICDAEKVLLSELDYLEKKGILRVKKYPEETKSQEIVEISRFELMEI